MSPSSSQASTTRRLTTGTVALAVATAATLATAPAFTAPRPVQDPQGFIVSSARTQISFTHSPPASSPAPATSTRHASDCPL
ncbi:hypothetical protein FE382_00910 [Corynebacterium diphtheriae]|nr:hypothetical protein FE382_00910 [Corynebacterium diphtheriae]